MTTSPHNANNNIDNIFILSTESSKLKSVLN